MPTPIAIATALLVRDGRALLVHRHPSRGAYPDCWDLVGGHVEAGETPEEAVVRECREELAVHIHDPRPIPMPFADSTLDMHAFRVTRWSGEPVNAAPDEHDDLRWFLPADITGLRIADEGCRDSIAGAIVAP